MKTKKFKGINKNLVIFILIGVFILLLIIPREIFEKPSTIGGVVASVRVYGKNPPSFDNELQNQTVNQSSNFLLDVNCSDIDTSDVVSYYENFTGFEINISTGLINQTNFSQSFVGNNTINVSCDDGIYNISRIFILTVLNINEPPVLSSIGPQLATEGILFTLDVDATDIDNDNLTFSASTSLFTINSATGLINFTPALSQIGNYTINISAFDGQLYAYEVVSFRIVRGAFCGDNSCGGSESCSSCASDCGSCQAPPAAEEGEGAGAEEGSAGGEGGASVSSQEFGLPQAPYYRCDEKWECSDWSICSLDGLKKRKCKDINKCGAIKKKPSEIEKCEYQPTCSDGIKNGNEEGVDCGGICQPCIVANCFDKIQNQNETDVDCGGPCKACEIKKFAKIPFIELPAIVKIPKKFPWIFVALISTLIALTIAGDQVYVRKITSKEFEEYRKEISRYRLLRRKIYKFIANISIISLIASSYIYLFSDNTQNMLKYVWIPLLIIILVPAIVSLFVRHYTYFEYKKRRKEEMLKQTHKREIAQLINVENKLLEEMESKLKDSLYSLALGHKFDSFPEVYAEFNPLYSLLSSIAKNRRDMLDFSKISAEIFKKLSDLSENKTLIKASKDYPEFMSILKILKDIPDNINLDNYYSEEELLDEIREISKTHMISVIKSSPKLVALYNELVDIYDYFMEKHAGLHEKDKEVSGIERDFAERVKGITKKPSLLEIVQKDADIVLIYNSVIELLNHYLKKQELSIKIANL